MSRILPAHLRVFATDHPNLQANNCLKAAQQTISRPRRDGARIACAIQQAINMDSAAQIGNRVSFHISDVYLPEPSEVLAHLTPELEANGVIVEFSDSGSSRQAYAVVRLTAEQSVLLPVTALRVVS
ncbi:MAG TPA: hypothetical protein VF283_18745 [Bryobacteraceae bacterium]